MANISLQGSIRTCKVDPAWSTRIQSDRFQNPNIMVCPVWNGMNNKGQPVCADSYWTKRAGCNSPEDRVVVENAQRPQYAEYINLDAQGIRGNMYGFPEPQSDELMAEKDINKVHDVTGQFGLVSGFRQNVYPGCMSSSLTPYESAMAEEAKQRRMQQVMQEGFIANNYRKSSGMACS